LRALGASELAGVRADPARSFCRSRRCARRS